MNSNSILQLTTLAIIIIVVQSAQTPFKDCGK
jgi:hypothetical protein